MRALWKTHLETHDFKKKIVFCFTVFNWSTVQVLMWWNLQFWQWLSGHDELCFVILTVIDFSMFFTGVLILLFPFGLIISFCFVFQYRIGQLYMISKHSHEQSDRGEGVEVVQNVPFEDPTHGQGQFTEKRVYLNRLV